MKKDLKKLKLKHGILMLLMLLVLSCGTTAVLPAPITAEAAAIKLNKQNVVINKGNTVSLKIKGTKDPVTWKSNKPSIAKVSANGLVTAKKMGKAKITAKVGGKKYTCTVTVENPYFKSKNRVMYVGERIEISPSGTNQNPTKWKSSDPTVATVSKAGLITGKSVGTTTITATINGEEFSFSLKVKKGSQTKPEDPEPPQNEPEQTEPEPPQTEPEPPQTEPEPEVPTYGSISGNISYYYNRYVGNKPDTGANVILVPKSGSAKNLTSLYLSGSSSQEEVHLYVAKVDGAGNYRINHVATGDYRVLLVSRNTSTGAWFDAYDDALETVPDSYYEMIYDWFAPEYLNIDVAKDLAKHTVSFHKYRIEDITIYENEDTPLSYDFGVTYI